MSAGWFRGASPPARATVLRGDGFHRPQENRRRCWSSRPRPELVVTAMLLSLLCRRFAARGLSRDRGFRLSWDRRGDRLSWDPRCFSACGKPAGTLRCFSACCSLLIVEGWCSARVGAPFEAIRRAWVGRNACRAMPGSQRGEDQARSMSVLSGTREKQENQVKRLPLYPQPLACLPLPACCALKTWLAAVWVQKEVLLRLPSSWSV